MSRGRHRLGGRAGVAVAAVAICAALAATLAVARPIYVETGGIRISFDAGFTPTSMPRSTRVPLGIQLSSAITAKHGGQVPPVTRATIPIDRALAIDTRGVAACTLGQIEGQTTAAAESACRAAVVGRGAVGIEIALPEAAPFTVHSTLLAFNGGTVGPTTTVYLHAFIDSPAPQAVVVPVVFTRLTKGGYGMRAQATLPTIASGSGSLTTFELEVARTVPTGSGGRHGYVTGRCSDGNIVFEPEVRFADGGLARGLLAVGCQSKS